MKHLEQMIEQQVRDYEARLNHVDRLVDRAKEIEHPEVHKELADLLARRHELAVELDEMKLKSLDDWREEELAKAGPMGIWDAVAQQLENLVERFEHRE